MISPIRDGSVRLISCSRALTKSGLSDVDYALNPYYGCAHGCLYCYAPDVLRCERGIDWGNWVEARVNISRRLKKEIEEVGNSVIGLSTVTDPYQPAEKQLELTRACLEVISESDASLMVMTKSPLILRDIDILGQIKNVEICVSVTALDEHISLLFEGKLPGPKARLSVLERFSRAGFRTDAMVSPLLISDEKTNDQLEQLVEAIADTGCRSITFDRLRLRETARLRLKRHFADKENASEAQAIIGASERISIETALASLVSSKRFPEMTFHSFSKN
ncbi:MAG: radical SAM protein [Thermoplasmata archaeon]